LYNVRGGTGITPSFNAQTPYSPPFLVIG